MSGPAKVALSLWRGNTKTFTFRLREDAENYTQLTVDDTFVMTVKHGGTDLTLNGSVTDVTLGQVEFSFTVSQSRALAGNVTYEVEWFNSGDQTTIIYGPILMKGGDNAD